MKIKLNFIKDVNKIYIILFIFFYKNSINLLKN